jgi:BirA family biotin operon repressor/biotin-[acetyl-CoA-carboxylase] ligase
MGDTLAPNRLEPLLTGAFGRPYLYRESCESTQRLLRPELSEGAVAVCDFQRAGRGRLGRRWEAPPGTAILCSVLLRPPPEHPAAELSLLGGLAVAETAERAGAGVAQIKWPNDVLVKGRKVAGVLAEVVADAVMLGIGLNVNQRPDELPPDAHVPAASLFTLDRIERDRAPILADLISRIEACYRLWARNGFGQLHERLRARDFLQGRRVRVAGATATAVGIDPSGRLEVDLNGERRLVESGEVEYER